MNVLYADDNTTAVVMPVQVLIENFNANGGWVYRYNAADMKDELASRGWYEGLHENGRYLVLNLGKFGLERQYPDCRHHRDNGRGICCDCGTPL